MFVAQYCGERAVADEVAVSALSVFEVYFINRAQHQSQEVERAV
jgi:hypothetical protein